MERDPIANSERKQIKKKIISLLMMLITLLAISTIVYSKLEGWDLIDSLYFSTVTITTIGYGDLHPTSHLSKLFTVGFVLSGVTLMLYILSVLGTHYFYYLESQQNNLNTNVKKVFSNIYNKKQEKWVTLKIPENKNR